MFYNIFEIIIFAEIVRKILISNAYKKREGKQEFLDFFVS